MCVKREAVRVGGYVGVCSGCWQQQRWARQGGVNMAHLALQSHPRTK